MMIKAIIFDYGGTMTMKSDPLYAQISSLFGVSGREAREKSEEHICSLQRGEISERDFWNLLQESFGSKPNGPMEFIFSRYAEHSKPDREMRGIVKELKKRGYVTALLSNTVKPHVDYNKSRGNYDLFSPVILSCEVGMRKPEKRIYRLALRMIGIRPEECVFVDDEPLNLPPAGKLGMKTILFRDAKQLRDDLGVVGVAINL